MEVFRLPATQVFATTLLSAVTFSVTTNEPSKCASRRGMTTLIVGMNGIEPLTACVSDKNSNLAELHPCK